MTQEGVLVTNRAFVSNGAERLAQQIPLESRVNGQGWSGRHCCRGGHRRCLFT